MPNYITTNTFVHEGADFPRLILVPRFHSISINGRAVYFATDILLEINNALVNDDADWRFENIKALEDSSSNKIIIIISYSEKRIMFLKGLGIKTDGNILNTIKNIKKADEMSIENEFCILSVFGGNHFDSEILPIPQRLRF